MLATVLVVLSYAHRDTALMQSVASELSRAGCSVWTDQQIKPGEHWDVAVESAIDRANVVLVLASPDAYRSPNVRDELARAIRTGKRVVAVRLSGADLPLPLERRVWIRRGRIKDLCRKVAR